MKNLSEIEVKDIEVTTFPEQPKTKKKRRKKEKARLAAFLQLFFSPCSRFAALGWSC